MNPKYVKILRGCFLLILLLVVVNFDALAQCPMCKMAAESNLKDGGTAGKGLNAGILMLLGMPYWIVGGIAYVWWRNRKKKDEFDGNELTSADLA
jgi:hypothetical protein